MSVIDANHEGKRRAQGKVGWTISSVNYDELYTHEERNGSEASARRLKEQMGERREVEIARGGKIRRRYPSRPRKPANGSLAIQRGSDN